MSDRLIKQMMPDEIVHKVDLHEGINSHTRFKLKILLDIMPMNLIVLTELDGDQSVLFYCVDPGHALERHAGKAKFKNKFYFQYEREESWTRPCVRAFQVGHVNAGIVFQGFQRIAGNAVPLCHVFYTDKAGATKHCSYIGGQAHVNFV